MKLVIVESPTKAKTISKFLGAAYKVESSYGHTRDLPKSKMGIDIAGGTFEPTYEVPKDKTPQVNKLKKLAKEATEVIFASDEDREGEAISWHLAELFKIDPKKAKRIVFHEITKSAIEEAIANPRHIDLKLVDAQQARRILDRIVGYELSPFLWKKVARGLSAGRVQSVAVRLVVEREEERKAFVSQEYWSIDALFNKVADFSGKLHSIADKKIDKLGLKTKEEVDQILANLDSAQYKIKDIVKKETKRTPPPPFTTSTLQQQASYKLGYSAKQTMRLAQQLYEGIKIGTEGQVGLITYMRTDALNLSEKFLTESKDFVAKKYGEKFALSKPRFYANKSKNAQEAHEAIRPTDVSKNPESISAYLDPQQLKLYSLIWKRAVATQMAVANLNKENIDIEAKEYLFRATGQSVVFPGWLQLYPEQMKDEMLPEMKIDELVDCKELKPEQHFTEPKPRYSDATLVKAMEEYGIGRPSTYAPTISTIESRGYVERDENKRLKPLDIAFVVNSLLVEHFPDVVDYKFTATMEENLDEIAHGTKDWQPIIATFYFPFHENLVSKSDNLTKEETVSMRELGIDPKSKKPIYGRIGRFGPFVQKGSKDDEEKPTFAKLKPGQTIDELTLADALELFKLPRSLGKDKTGEEILASVGRFGPYVKVGAKFYSTKDKDPYTITLKEALEVIREKDQADANKTIKLFAGSTIQVLNGRYGPYITDTEKKINAKIPKDIEPKNLTLEECEKLITEAPSKKRSAWAKKKSE
ncbi:MAG: type I DNA topoisomerase [Candidatus Magasanikbacteria bacterium]